MLIYIPFTKIRIPVPFATILITAALIACIFCRLIPFNKAIEDYIPDYYQKSLEVGTFSLILLVVIWGWEIMSNINKRT